MNPSPPKVSVVVTTFNRVHLLKETLDSILGQTYTDLEVIVVDNCSSDGTAEYLRSVDDPRVRWYVNANNGVIAVNRNLGISKAQGVYVAFCDDDDLWLPDKLSFQMELMERSPVVVLSYTNASTFYDNRTLSNRMIRRRVDRHHFWQLLRGNYIPNSSVVVRRQVFLDIGEITDDRSLREDYEMWLRIARKYTIAGIDRPLICYRVHPNNVAGNKVAETMRAIRTLRSVASRLNLPAYLVQPNLAFQFMKYLAYRIGLFR